MTRNPRTIVFVGASYLFVPKVVTDLARRRDFVGSRLVIHDIQPAATDLIAAVCRRISDAANADFTVEARNDLSAALQGADYVLLCISVGGREAAGEDIALCKRFGCEHVIGDTIGPAALIRNLRTLPVVREIARTIDRICPTATVINFSNPMSAITGVLAAHTRAPTVGLCHGTDELIDLVAGAYSVDPSHVTITVAGVNHLAFATDVLIDGQRVPTPELFDRITAYEQSSRYNATDPAWGSSLSYRLTTELGRRLGLMPNNPDRHTVEFFSWFLQPGRMLFTAETADYPDRIRRHRELGEKLARIAAGEEPPDLSRPSGERADELILACDADSPRRIILNAPNHGAIAGLPADATVEAYRPVSRHGIGQYPPVELPLPVLEIVRRMVTIHTLTLAAAWDPRVDTILPVLMLEPNTVGFQEMLPFARAIVDRHRRWETERV